MENYNAVAKISVDYKSGIYKEAEKNNVSITEMYKKIFEAGLNSLGISKISSMTPEGFEFDVLSTSKINENNLSKRMAITPGYVKVSRYIDKTKNGKVRYEISILREDTNKIALENNVYLMFSVNQKTVLFACPLIKNGTISENDPRVKRYSISSKDHSKREKYNRFQSYGTISDLLDNIFGTTFDKHLIELEYCESFGCYMIRNTVEENVK